MRWIQLQKVLSQTKVQVSRILHDAQHLLTSNTDHRLSSRATDKPGFYSLRTFFLFVFFVFKSRKKRQPGSKPSRSLRPKNFHLFFFVSTKRPGPELFALKRGTPSPARRRRLSPASSGYGTAARCSPASGPPCPCPGGSSPPPRTAPPSGPAPPSRPSSGPASSSCCGLAAAPRRGAWPGRRRAATWRGSHRRRRPSSSLVELRPPSPASSARPEEAEPLGRWLEREREIGRNEFNTKPSNYENNI